MKLLSQNQVALSNLYGFYVDTMAVGTLTNHYGRYLSDLTKKGELNMKKCRMCHNEGWRLIHTWAVECACKFIAKMKENKHD